MSDDDEHEHAEREPNFIVTRRSGHEDDNRYPVTVEEGDVPDPDKPFDTISEYTLQDVIEDNLETPSWDPETGEVSGGGSIEYRGLHISPQSRDGEYLAQPDGYVYPVCQFYAFDFENVRQLIRVLNRQATLVWGEMDREDREEAFKVLTRDPEKGSEENHIHVGDTAPVPEED